MLKTEVPTKMLRAIWELSNVNKDGVLDDEEFAIAMHLCEVVKGGGELPEILPIEMIPISKRMKGMKM